jgi:hypothetical protein
VRSLPPYYIIYIILRSLELVVLLEETFTATHYTVYHTLLELVVSFDATALDFVSIHVQLLQLRANSRTGLVY